jgi:F-type H+-transporting ATPase subunit delta
MNNPRLAARYAKSIIDLAIERKQLDLVYADMQFILGVTRTNRDFVALLRSPIISTGTKRKVIESITTGRVGELTAGFIRLLVAKSRETNLPEIAASFLEQYNEINNIHRIKITTAVPMSDTLKDSILSKVKATSPDKKFELETVVKDEIIGGFVLETDGRLIDASILHDLKDVRKQFQNNDYLHKLR